MEKMAAMSSFGEDLHREMMRHVRGAGVVEVAATIMAHAEVGTATRTDHSEAPLLFS